MDTPNTELPIIDWDLAAKLVGGKTSLAQEMFSLFMDDLPHSQARIQKAFDSQSLVLLKDEIHRFLGGCSYCGIPRLKAVTLVFENALKQGVTDRATLTALFEQFNNEIAVLTEVAREVGN